MTTRLAPVTRADLVRRLRSLGFDGPYSGGKHAFMVRGERTVRVPNPHGADVGTGLLPRILQQAGITRDEWFRTD